MIYATHRCDLWEDISTMGIRLECGGHGPSVRGNGWWMVREREAESYEWELPMCPFCGRTLRDLEGLKGGVA